MRARAGCGCFNLYVLLKAVDTQLTLGASARVVRFRLTSVPPRPMPLAAERTHAHAPHAPQRATCTTAHFRAITHILTFKGRRSSRPVGLACPVRTLPSDRPGHPYKESERASMSMCHRTLQHTPTHAHTHVAPANSSPAPGLCLLRLSTHTMWSLTHTRRTHVMVHWGARRDAPHDVGEALFRDHWALPPVSPSEPPRKHPKVVGRVAVLAARTSRWDAGVLVGLVRARRTAHARPALSARADRPMTL